MRFVVLLSLMMSSVAYGLDSEFMDLIRETWWLVLLVPCTLLMRKALNKHDNR